MYTITLEINQVCNLSCKYCYLGEKSGSRMSFQTGIKAVDMAFEKVRAHKDRTLWVDFIGGEALLDFPLLQKLVDYCEKKNKSIGYKLLFSVTTNATVFNEEMLRFLTEKGFALKVSIDGKKEINDLNRVANSGGSVHDRIISNMGFIRRFEEKTGRLVQVTNVITHNNYEHYYDTLVYLTETLGFRAIDTAIDLFVRWTEEELRVLEENIRKSFGLFIQAAKENRGFRWEFADKLMGIKESLQKERKKFYSCGAGIVSAYVRTDGGIFACPGNLDESVRLGNVEEGIVISKIRELREFNGINNEKCKECELTRYCTAQSCRMQNLAITGDVNEPIPVMCRMRKLVHQMYMENEPLLGRLVM